MNPHLYKERVDGFIRRCVPEQEQEQILHKCHSEAYGGHHAGDRTAHKVLQSGFNWPTLFKDACNTTKKYTSMMIRVCHSRSLFLSCMYIHEKFMTESR